MANLKEVRERISSVNNTQQITKAMKMVSAAKLRRAQQAIQKMRPYTEKLQAMLSNILSNMEKDAVTSFGKERPVERACIVVVTSNRGLCGAFNNNISKKGAKLIENKYPKLYEQGNLDILNIGKKGYEYLSKRYPKANYNTEHLEIFDDLSFDNVARVSSQLMEAFIDEKYDAVDVAYGSFRNAVVQIPTVEQFLPVAKLEEEAEVDSNLRADYLFEPGKEELLEYLVPSILKTQLHKYLLDTHASEHGARMTAMDAATDNAQELLRDLKISYNKARQEAITNEISEIVGGAAALENG